MKKVIGIIVATLVLITVASFQLWKNPEEFNGLTTNKQSGQQVPASEVVADAIALASNNLSANAEPPLASNQPDQETLERIFGEKGGSENTPTPEELAAIRQKEMETMAPRFIDSEQGSIADSPTEDALSAMAAEIRVNAGPNALDEAASLLGSNEPGVPLIAAKLLVQEDNWSESVYDKVNNHPDIAVPLYVWQGLMEAGRIDDANALSDSLVQRVGGMQGSSDLLGRSALPGTAVRALAHIAQSALKPEAVNEILQAVIANKNSDYSARMGALMAYRDVLPFEDYRDKVYEELARKTEVNDPVWAEGLQRLARDLEGPLPVLTGPRTITADDIDMLVAHEYPATLEDIALRLETSLVNDQTTFATGLVARLQQLVNDRTGGPMDESEKIALQRIQNIAGAIVETDKIAKSDRAPE